LQMLAWKGAWILILMALRTIKLLLQWPIFESNLSLVFFSKQSITMSLIDATRLVCSDLYQFVWKLWDSSRIQWSIIIFPIKLP
jgi:hypothetical protein